MKVKKLLAVFLVLSMLFVVASCRKAEEPDVPSEDSAPESGSESDLDDVVAEGYKIGIVTGTVSQGEEEYQAALKMIDKYGADKIVTATYPDNFAQETETTIANIVAVASDPAVKAMVICQGVPGTAAAIDKIKETNPDMFFIVGVAAEAPDMIAPKADIVMNIDDIGTGKTIPQKAFDQGAKKIIHYSFPRHLSYDTISIRREIMIATCKELGIEFIDVTAPDPSTEAGVAGAQQFILEDVPRQIEEHGKDTAFYSTNCGMMEPLIKSVSEGGAIFPQQCCPSPFHGYPAAFGIDTTGHAGDVQYMLDETKKAVAAAGNTGRMSTWKVPVNMLMVEAATDYAVEFAEGKVGRQDIAKFTEIANSIAECKISQWDSEKTGLLENYYLILADFYDF